MRNPTTKVVKVYLPGKWWVRFYRLCQDHDVYPATALRRMAEKVVNGELPFPVGPRKTPRPFGIKPRKPRKQRRAASGYPGMNVKP